MNSSIVARLVNRFLFIERNKAMDSPHRRPASFSEHPPAQNGDWHIEDLSKLAENYDTDSIRTSRLVEPQLFQNASDNPRPDREGGWQAGRDREESILSDFRRQNILLGPRLDEEISLRLWCPVPISRFIF